MNRIDGAPAATPQFSTDTELPAGSQAQVGSFRGERVIVDDGASVLANSPEELSFYAAEGVEDKTLEERTVNAERPIELMRLQEIMAYLEATQSFDDPKKLVYLAKRMQSGEGNPQELARQESDDPTEQYVLLQYALQDGLQNGISEKILDSLRDALLDLEIEHGPQIRCGLNTIGAATEVGADRATISAFQSTYRDAVLGGATLQQTLATAIERLAGKNGEDFERGLKGLIKAGGQDLAAARPSTDPVRLQSMVQDLYHLEVACTVMEGCKELSATMLTKHGVGDVQPVAMMKDLVAIAGEKWVNAGRFTEAASRFGASDVEPQIAFLAATKGLMRDMPIKIFSDDDTRRSILDAAQEALDQAIDLEEEE